MAWRLRRPTRGESVAIAILALAIAILALLFVAAAFNQGWITPPTWYTSRIGPTPAVDAPRRVTPAQAAASAVRAQRAAEAAATSAKFAEEGSAKNASSAASSARASASSASAAAASEGKSEAAAIRAEKAAQASSKSEKKRAVRPAAESKPAGTTPQAQQRQDVTQIASASATGPGSFSSLQPFQRFARGAGEGMAYEYRSRTKAEFVALLRDKDLAKREMRVPCEVIVRQMAEGHKTLPLEGCEGTAALIERDSRFVVVECDDEMFLRNNFLTVTNESGSSFGVWHRKCLPNEQILSFEGQPLISLLCLNVAVPVQPVREPPAATAPPLATSGPLPTTSGCPKGIALYANAWTMESMPGDLRRRAEALIAVAAARDSQNASNPEAYKPDALSRTIGDELIATVSVRAPVGTDIRAQLLDPESLRVERDLGTFRLNSGIAKIPLAPDDRKMIVQTIWPGWFSSPTVSGGERRLWLFPNEWANKTGGRYCTKQVNGAYLQANKPGP